MPIDADARLDALERAVADLQRRVAALEAIQRTREERLGAGGVTPSALRERVAYLEVRYDGVSARLSELNASFIRHRR